MCMCVSMYGYFCVCIQSVCACLCMCVPYVCVCVCVYSRGMCLSSFMNFSLSSLTLVCCVGPGVGGRPLGPASFGFMLAMGGAKVEPGATRASPHTVINLTHTHTHTHTHTPIAGPMHEH